MSPDDQKPPSPEVAALLRGCAPAVSLTRRAARRAADQPGLTAAAWHAGIGSARETRFGCALRRGYAAVVAKRRRRGCAPDLEGVLAQLRADEEDDRVRALHRVCPYAAGFLVYERFSDEVRRLQKDPSARVRAAALHVEQDACLIELLAANLDRAEEQGLAVQRHRLGQGAPPPSGNRVLAAAVTRATCCGWR